MKQRHWLTLLSAAVGGAALASAAATGPPHFTDVPQDHWARGAITMAAATGVMPSKTPRAFKPDQTVTRAELATILVRLVDYLENRGPQKLSKSPAKPHVPRSQRAALARLPRNHPAYPALARLVEGGYVVPDVHGESFLPARETLDQPVSRDEVSSALAGVAIRVTEKRVGIEHPDSLTEGYRLKPGEERPTIPKGQQPHRHGVGDQHGPGPAPGVPGQPPAPPQ